MMGNCVPNRKPSDHSITDIGTFWQNNLNTSKHLTTAYSRRRRSGVTNVQFTMDKNGHHLVQAALNEDCNEMKKLLEDGANPNHVVVGTGTALHKACKKGNMDMIQLLLDYGANPNCQDRMDCSPFHMAIKWGHVDVARCLITKHMAQVDLVMQRDSQCAIHVAAGSRNIAMLQLLLEHGAEVNPQNLYGNTPLLIAAQLGYCDIVDILLKNGADVNAVNNSGWTSLTLASEAGSIDVVCLLLEKNAHVNSQNNYGRTSLHWACIRDNLDIVMTLIKAKADPDFRDVHGKTPIEYSKSTCMTNIFKLSDKIH